MTTSADLDALAALRAANPRHAPGFDRAVAAATEPVRARVAAGPDVTGVDVAHVSQVTDVTAPLGGRAAAGVARGRRSGARRGRPHRRGLWVPAVGTLATAAVATAAFVAFQAGSPAAPGAAAAIGRAVSVSAASADESGVALVRITRDGAPWAGSIVRWNGTDLSVSRDVPERPRRPGSELLVVDGVLYGISLRDGRWVRLGDPAGIDPTTGTTPAEYLATVGEDVGGTTLRRIVGGMADLTERRLPDGSVVYSGDVAAGLLARETSTKEGEELRVLPFGFVAHDEAADPSAPLHTSVTVDPGGVIRELRSTWGGGGSAWTFTVTYSDLGTTPAPTAPADAEPLRKEPSASSTG